MTMHNFPSTEDCKRIEYLINHDERLKKVVVDFITRNVALVDYIDEAYGKELGLEICEWCFFQSMLWLNRITKESSDGD